jgi:hypothetical protein
VYPPIRRMRNILFVTVAAALSGILGCGSSDEGGPAYLQTRAAAGKPPVLDSVTHIQVIPPVLNGGDVAASPRTVTDPDSIAAIVSFVTRRASAWKAKRGLRETPRGSLILDFYTGPALVATVVDRGRNISLQGHLVGLIQKLPRQEKATLAALVGMSAER